MVAQAASFKSDSYNPDRLIAGVTELHSRKVTLLSGENRARGAVLGKKATAGTVVSTVPAGNVGNGVMGAATVGATAREGNYKVVIVEPAANAGAFVLEDPDGAVIGHGNVAAAFTGAVNFTLADGATDFSAGDFFILTVSAVTYKYQLSLAAATDGTQIPEAVLADDCDASAADAECNVYLTGDFNERALVFGAGQTAATVREPLRARGIFLIATQGA